jgi:hypothetical protein
MLCYCAMLRLLQNVHKGQNNIAKLIISYDVVSYQLDRMNLQHFHVSFFASKMFGDIYYFLSHFDQFKF